MITRSSNQDRAARIPIEPLLKVADVERILGVTRRTIQRLCDQGVLPMPLKIGGSCRWTLQDMQALIGKRANSDVTKETESTNLI